ncbi:DUF3606 domain-containing protein [Mesorhizobium sp. B2-3-5]|nr:DUF3606 domain-containing protein [Mesorhizobium sp. B2-3-5]TPM34917.1 DUF3606 domain-containing protein [Mesorhizobium sp. B2-3-5]
MLTSSAANSRYEVEYFAHKFGLMVEQVRDLVQRHGHDRELLERRKAPNMITLSTAGGIRILSFSALGAERRRPGCRGFFLWGTSSRAMPEFLPADLIMLLY